MAFVLRVIQAEGQADLLIYGLIQEGREGQDELTEVYHLVIIGIEQFKQVLSVHAIFQADRHAKLLIVNHPVVLLCLAQLIEEQIQVVDLIRSESGNFREFHYSKSLKCTYSYEAHWTLDTWSWCS